MIFFSPCSLSHLILNSATKGHHLGQDNGVLWHLSLVLHDYYVCAHWCSSFRPDSDSVKWPKHMLNCTHYELMSPRNFIHMHLDHLSLSLFRFMNHTQLCSLRIGWNNLNLWVYICLFLFDPNLFSQCLFSVMFYSLFHHILSYHIPSDADAQTDWVLSDLDWISSNFSCTTTGSPILWDTCSILASCCNLTINKLDYYNMKNKSFVIHSGCWIKTTRANGITVPVSTHWGNEWYSLFFHVIALWMHKWSSEVKSCQCIADCKMLFHAAFAMFTLRMSLQSDMSIQI